MFMNTGNTEKPEKDVQYRLEFQYRDFRFARLKKNFKKSLKIAENHGYWVIFRHSPEFFRKRKSLPGFEKAIRHLFPAFECRPGSILVDI